ncbi:MAG: DUF4349 domain-containing protein [Actinomycetota bacterium]
MKRWIWALLVGLLVISAACKKEDTKTLDSGKSQSSPGQTREGISKIGPPASDEKGAIEPMPADGGSGAMGAPDGDRAIGTTADQPVTIPPLPDIPPSQARVIKNANLEVKIKKGAFQDQFKRAGQLAEEFGGYVTNTSVSEEKGKIASGTITIRVPSDRFQSALNRLKGLGKVTTESQDGQDVTREFVDLEARLRNAKSQEAFYLRLLDQAKSVSDMIQVQQQLINVQLQIEQIQGQLQYLKDHTGFSTITARIYEPGAAVPDGKPRPLGKAWNAAVDAFQNVIGGLVVALGWIAPIALIAAAGYLVWRLSRRSKSTPTTPTTPLS